MRQNGRWKLRLEPEFNRLVSFVSGRLPLPLAQRIFRSINQQRMAAFHLDRFSLAVGSNQYVCPYDALKIQGTGEAGILRHHFRENLAVVFRSFLGVRIDGNESKYCR